ncbi:hypothetical protein [Halomonas denitrificans]|uniref:hypothetical protein n=1 Tax=Halomonas denitrificans TaxID=370769 RepID=UPI001C99CCB2|nr:hypothetical protein [Halomonas denitrificans]MBY5969930.1 hypothetical protein [Halomonas denitrificans]
MVGVDVELSLDQLILDESNFRIDEVDHQVAAIKSILRHQNNGEKIYNLAKHISEKKQLAPGDRLIVIPDDQQEDDNDEENSFYVVMEGNRRVTSLLLLRSPEIIKNDFPRLYSKFVKLKSDELDSLFDSIPCSLVSDRDTALEWIELKHGTNLNGVGLEKWDADAAARFSESRGTYRRWRIAVKKLEDHGSEHIDYIVKGIRSKTTAVERVLSAREIKDSLRMQFKNNEGSLNFVGIDVDHGMRVLEALMFKMAGEEFSTASVHSLTNRNMFIYGFLDMVNESEKEVGSEGGDSGSDSGLGSGKGETVGSGEWPSGTKWNPKPSYDERPDSDANNDSFDAGESSGGKGPVGKKPLKELSDRLYLAPAKQSHTYHIVDDAINKIYKEARKLPVKGLERVSGVLTRVFLELSCDLYLEKHQVPMPDHFSHKGINKWEDAKLRQKIEKVVEDLDPRKKNSDLSQVRKGLGSDEWLHSVDTLHSFVHDKLGNVTDKEIKIIWDRFHPLFKAIHDSLSD